MSGERPEPGIARAALAGPFPAFVLAFAALFGAFGAQRPFLPAFLAGRGLTPGQIGLVLAAATGVRLVAGPALGQTADRLAARCGVLTASALGAGLVSFAYLTPGGLWTLLAVGMLHAALIAPLAPLATALALAAARDGAFAYGWVRGAGSGGFMLANLAAGGLVAWAGLDGVIAGAGALFLVSALAGSRLRVAEPVGERVPVGMRGVKALLAIPSYRWTLAAAALVAGSHALNDTVTVIGWRAAGLAPGAIGALWAEAVAAEVAVLLFLGPPLLGRLGPGRCVAIAALAGVVRWTVLAATTATPALAANQLLHGLTFGLLHLANVQTIAASVPARLSGGAQTLYSTLGTGLAAVVLTAASGGLYAALGARAYLVMAGLCLAALPVALVIRRRETIVAGG